MITTHSIDLTRLSEEPCFGLGFQKECKVLTMQHEECGSYKCPFYKPKLCKAWVRIEDTYGINLIPPEEAYGR